MNETTVTLEDALWMAGRLREQGCEILTLRAEIDDLRVSVIAFGGPAMVEWAQLHELPKGHLFSSHYDILARAGARMNSFIRHDTD